MDHFLSGLDHGPNPWYAPRPAVAAHGHEFSIGNTTCHRSSPHHLAATLLPLQYTSPSRHLQPLMYCIGTSSLDGSFQLIPISGSNNPTSSNHNTYSTTSTQPHLQSAFKPPVEPPKVKSESREVDERDDSKTPTPSVALTPLSTNMAHHSHKAKAGERWDTKKVCNICGKVLSRGDKLKNHIRTHTKNFPFECDDCGQGFLRSEGLRVHNRVHTGERPYVCMVCGKAYTRKDKLTRHAIVHTGERPFVCQHCGKSFTRKDKMQRHEMIHKVDKPFTCVPCNLEFVRQETYNAHMERKHPDCLPYTVVQQPRSGSPGYHPQGLNLTDNKSGIKLAQSSSKSLNTPTSASATTSSSTAFPSGTSLLSGSSLTTCTSLPGGSHLTSGPSVFSGTSLLSGSSLLSNSSLLSGTSLASGSGSQTLS
ncbi:gastrula zinc finger protein XlCGF57.1-like isoform X1 [Homarus americanus]|uniref:gastrula zinc finger protein XlCGF57.1-like isoform X1 n=1 Tax=Homarus americanus TaxID=6706 RepID=UPI001C44D0B0|nr:gastrula zinc finger protein XlCGF57.1-like isoform X1 [Homarus americanus]XP_042231298.1 gastrula zinc finger protein XlCGF57.1-like isoform X1 [Homarus americanus]